MKILIVAPLFPPDPTGSSVFAEQQAREFVRQGHDVMVLANRPSRRLRLESPQVSLADLRMIRLRNTRIDLGKITWHYGIPFSTPGLLGRKFKDELGSFKPQVVLIHSTLFDLSLWALRHCARQKIPAVLVTHTALWHDHPLINKVMRWYGTRLLGPLVRNSRAKVISVDKWTRDNAVSLFASPESTTVIPISVPIGKMTLGNGERIRKKHSISGNPVILSLGHVIPLRNRVNLVRALPILITKYPSLTVLVVGMVNDDHFLQLADDLGVRNHIITVGAVPHAEIRNYLAIADIEIHDLDGRGLGITSIEAMDAGVPIVAWINDRNYPQLSLGSFGVSGFIEDCEPQTLAKAVIRMLDDQSFRDEVLQTQRRILAEVFPEKSVAEQYLRILSSDLQY